MRCRPSRPSDMAYRENKFVFEGVEVHYQDAGAGFPLLLLHGSGPGVSTLGNWRAVLEPLSERFHVFAMDLIGFGQSGRKHAAPYFDFPLWFRQCKAMIARMPEGDIGLLGHSISGALALKLAAAEPRIRKVMTTATMGGHFTVNEDTVRTWTFPRNRAELLRAAQGLIYDHSLIDETYLKNREAILFQGDYPQYFGSMFEGDKQKYADAALISDEELAKIKCDVVMLHGRDDRAFPAEPNTLSLSRRISGADVCLLARCGHSVAMEHPTKLLTLADNLFPHA